MAEHHNRPTSAFLSSNWPKGDEAKSQMLAALQNMSLYGCVKNLEITEPERDSIDGVDALYKRPGFLLRRAHQIAVSLFMEEAGKQDATTTTQYGILVILRSCEGLDQIGLSKKVGLDRSTTGLVIKKLETESLIVRIDDPQDRRRKIIVLTARGERKLDRLKEPAARAQKAALSAFTDDEAEQFLRLLDKFVQRFNGITRAPITDE